MKRILLATLAVASLTACNNSDETTGTLTVRVTDAPVDRASAVVVQFEGIELHGPDGRQTVLFDEPKTIDLLKLQGEDSAALIENLDLTAGQYQWLRLLVNAERQVQDSYIDFENGARHSLFVPSGSETGLKLVSGFVIPAGGSADFTIDFDLRKSVHQPEGAFDDYLLRPALRIVDNTVTGTISGTIDNALFTPDCAPVVYLFEGVNVIPDDEDANAPNPVTSAMPAMNTNTGNHDYTLGFISEGDYTAAFSCQAENDDPATDDEMVFIATQTASVTAGATSRADFN